MGGGREKSERREGEGWKEGEEGWREGGEQEREGGKGGGRGVEREGETVDTRYLGTTNDQLAIIGFTFSMFCGCALYRSSGLD